MVQQTYFQICIQPNFRSLSKIVLFAYLYIWDFSIYFSFCVSVTAV